MAPLCVFFFCFKYCWSQLPVKETHYYVLFSTTHIIKNKLRAYMLQAIKLRHWSGYRKYLLSRPSLRPRPHLPVQTQGQQTSLAQEPSLGQKPSHAHRIFNLKHIIRKNWPLPMLKGRQTRVIPSTDDCPPKSATLRQLNFAWYLGVFICNPKAEGVTLKRKKVWTKYISWVKSPPGWKWKPFFRRVVRFTLYDF